jgi:hypothetical protein
LSAIRPITAIKILPQPPPKGDKLSQKLNANGLRLKAFPKLQQKKKIKKMEKIEKIKWWCY